MKTSRWLLPAAAVAIAGAAVGASPADLDRSLDRSSDKGLFRVSIRSTEDPIPMNRIHRWTVKLADARGRPVAGARIAVDGGMPEHRHGLPTAPKARPAGAPGDYVIEGLKFSMDGWWELKLAIDASGRQDRITYNIML